MREGTNPARLGKKHSEKGFFHHVIVPVYVPNLEGYYKDGLEILKRCLESIYNSVHDKTFISVVNNGSCDAVKSYLNTMHQDAKIHEVIHTTNVGKINAIAKALAGHHFELVTITDADVLFIPGWQKAIYEIYENFPRAGMVGTTPLSWHCKYLNENVFLDNLLNKKFKIRAVKNPQAVAMFYKSIGWGFVNPQIHQEKILSLQVNDVIACLGCGHYTFTIKPELLYQFKQNHADELLSPKNDRDFIDIPSVAYGHWRLSTYENYTFHMGNTLESWMDEEIAKNKNPKDLALAEAPQFATKKRNKYYVQFKKYVVRQLLYKDFIFKKLLAHKGLTQEQVLKFMNR
ncbi:MAG: glycosyltransferase family 2 protein [Bacteroidetes bacterium]|nr:glycosyltransferase family 2 protein [Bacteroidota bacterium]